MSRPKGGRGVKAEYPTVTIRIPQGLRHTVTLMSHIYRESGADIVAIALTKLRQYKSSSTHTRDWTKLDQLIDDIASEAPAGATEAPWDGDLNQ